MTEENNAAVIERLAKEAAAHEVLPIEDGRVAAYILTGDQHMALIDVEQYAAAPSRKTGSVALADPDSFVTYVSRHSVDDGTTQWADIDKGVIVAVIDDHLASSDHKHAGWGDHRATLTLKATPDWTHWITRDGQYGEQSTFAEHIEDGVDAIIDPAAATMLEVAQSFTAKKGVHFESTKRLGGDIEFTYEETVAARAGVKGKLDVPEFLTLSLAPFEGSGAYDVRARIRYRLVDGQLRIGYRLIRPDKIRQQAFDDIVQQIAAASGLPVMAGTPRAAQSPPAVGQIIPSGQQF